MLYPQEACVDYTYPLMKNCYGNNPTAPYVIPVVKPWPDEYIDPATVNAFGKTADGYSATYRLDRREAIVIYGQLPPPGRYMGLQTFLFTQDGGWTSEDCEWCIRKPSIRIWTHQFAKIRERHPLA